MSAPVNRLIPPRIGWGEDSMELPETPLHRMRLTGMYPQIGDALRGLRQRQRIELVRTAHRSVHAGALSHDDDGRAA